MGTQHRELSRVRAVNQLPPNAEAFMRSCPGKSARGFYLAVTLMRTQGNPELALRDLGENNRHACKRGNEEKISEIVEKDRHAETHHRYEQTKRRHVELLELRARLPAFGTAKDASNQCEAGTESHQETDRGGYPVLAGYLSI